MDSARRSVSLLDDEPEILEEVEKYKPPRPVMLQVQVTVLGRDLRVIIYEYWVKLTTWAYLLVTHPLSTLAFGLLLGYMFGLREVVVQKCFDGENGKVYCMEESRFYVWRKAVGGNRKA